MAGQQRCQLRGFQLRSGKRVSSGAWRLLAAELKYGGCDGVLSFQGKRMLGTNHIIDVRKLLVFTERGRNTERREADRRLRAGVKDLLWAGYRVTAALQLEI